MPQFKSLNDVVSNVDDLVAHLRNLPTDTFEFTGAASEYSNWRDEQLAGHQTAVLAHQGHMRSPHSEMYISGPDAFKLLNYLATNSFANFKPGMAKQYIVCNPDGYLISDCILLYLSDNHFSLIGGTALMEWVRFNAAKHGYDVTLSANEEVTLPSGEKAVQHYYQFQLLGPNAKAIFEKLNGSYPQLRFFHLGEIQIAGRRVFCLGHSMLGVPGLECWFPLEWKDEVLGAILEAGKEFGLRQMGTRGYPSQTLESGWAGLPLPAIFTGDGMAEYREYLSADSFEGQISLAGSFVGERVEDYYFTPYDMSYGNFVKFDHDFIGREALEKLSQQPHGKKVTLEWNAEDVGKIHASYGGGDDLPYKWMDLPYSSYGMVQCDRVSKDGKTIGRSADVGYSHFARATLSLAIVDPDIEIGDEVIVTWGEEGGGTDKPSVERHRQIEVRAIVRPCPYTKTAREDYHAGGWRAQSA